MAWVGVILGTSIQKSRYRKSLRSQELKSARRGPENQWMCWDKGQLVLLPA